MTTRYIKAVGILGRKRQSVGPQAAALVVGKKTYQGGPCKHGHSGLRYTSNGNCVECLRAYGKEEGTRAYQRWRRAKMLELYGDEWRQKKNEINRQWIMRNPERRRAIKEHSEARWWNTYKILMQP